MSQEFFDPELFADFIAEAKEHLETIEPNLLELEKAPDNLALLNDIFRPMHSLKGASGFLGLNRINQLAHKSENILDELRKGTMVVTSEIMDVILASTDALRQMIDNLESTNAEGDVEIDHIMDVVRTNIKNLKGSVSTYSEVGKGTRFTLSLPLTLAIIDALMVNVSGQMYAIPLDAVSETTKIEAERLTDVKGRKAVTLRGEVLGVVELSEMLGLPRTDPLPDVLSVVVIHDNERRLGLVVDRLLERQEIVIKPLGAYLGDLKGISGATIMALIRGMPGIRKSTLAAMAVCGVPPSCSTTPTDASSDAANAHKKKVTFTSRPQCSSFCRR